MFVMSVPGLTWTEIERYDLPNLEAFFATAGLADLAPRGVSARSGPGDAYLTISAGSRATTERSVDGKVLALDDLSSGSAAGEIFRRRTGLVPDGNHVRSEEHTSELQSLMRTSYSIFCFKKKIQR